MLSVPLKPNRFILLGLGLILAIMPVYFLIIDQWLLLGHDTVPGSYKGFLLENIEGPKILIDSGSNSYFGIDTMMLGQHFKMPAINMADNAGNPIRHKFHYLVQHAQAGDIILLPLEWNQYTRTSIQDTYVEPLLLGKQNYYYDALPYSERIELVFTGVKLNFFLEAFSKRQSSPPGTQWAQRTLSEYAKRLAMKNDHSYGSTLRDDSGAAVADNVGPGSCDKYLFAIQRKQGFVLGEHFSEALAILQEAQQNGVTVIFTPPTVVDRAGDPRCYSTKKWMIEFDDLFQQLKAEVEAYGLLYLGNPQQFHFSEQYYNDTFYHLTEKGSKIRTRGLIKLMQQAGVKPQDRNYHPKQTLNQLGKLVDQLYADLGGV